MSSGVPSGAPRVDDPVCDRCGEPKSRHGPPAAFCPLYRLTFREPPTKFTNEGVPYVDERDIVASPSFQAALRKAVGEPPSTELRDAATRVLEANDLWTGTQEDADNWTAAIEAVRAALSRVGHPEEER